MTTHVIGPHTFPVMLGVVPEMQQQVEVLTKKGEDGHIRRAVGERQAPFAVRTYGYYQSEIFARNALTVFADMTLGPAVPFKKDGVDYASGLLQRRWYVSVLGVRPLRSEKKACIAGTTNTWFLETEWRLIQVPLNA